MSPSSTTTDNIEVVKLARELDLEPHALAFLDHLSVAELAELRHHLGRALFLRQEPRFRRMASAAKVIPNALLARAAQFTIGPKISAWVAATLPADQAIKLAGALDITFLTQVSRWLDPQRATRIVTGLPDATTIAIGKGLVDLGEWIPLGRYLMVVNADVITAVMQYPSADQLSDLARFIDVPTEVTEKQKATLQEVLERVGEGRAQVLLTSMPEQLAILLQS